MIEKQALTIASGAAVSDAFEMDDALFLVVHMPAAWTAASLAFKVAPEKGGTFVPLYDENGALLELTVAESTAVRVPTNWLAGNPWVQLWSETAGADVAQGAARTITVAWL